MPPSVSLLQEQRRQTTFDELIKFDSSQTTPPQQHSAPTKLPLLQTLSRSQTPNHYLPQQTIKLNDGNEIPLLGIGTWNAQGAELKEAIKAAIYAGYRHIDTAANYKNESVIGEAVAECINEGAVCRKELYITTKVWNNSHSRKAVPRALQASLKALKLNYVDLYLIHYPIGYKEGDELSPVDEKGVLQTSDVDYVETWLGMQDVKHLGLARSIGVSNFNKDQLTRVFFHCSVVPAINQVECHPYLNQVELINFCRMHGVELTAYSPLGSPGRQVSTTNKLMLINDPVVVGIARRIGATPGQVLISYQLHRKVVVIPKAILREHLEANLRAINLKLSEDDVKQLNSLNCNHRFMLFERCLGHKYYPFNEDCAYESAC